MTRCDSRINIWYTHLFMKTYLLIREFIFLGVKDILVCLCWPQYIRILLFINFFLFKIEVFCGIYLLINYLPNANKLSSALFNLL